MAHEQEKDARTMLFQGGAPTAFEPPAMSLERVKVRANDGRTMYDVYEPRYHGHAEAEDGASPSAPPTNPVSRTTSRLVTKLERNPLTVIAVLFAVVLFLSAAVSALAMALLAKG